MSETQKWLRFWEQGFGLRVLAIINKETSCPLTRKMISDLLYANDCPTQEQVVADLEEMERSITQVVATVRELE